MCRDGWSIGGSNGQKKTIARGIKHRRRRGVKIITTVVAEEDSWESRRKLALDISAGADENPMLRERRLVILDIS